MERKPQPPESASSREQLCLYNWTGSTILFSQRLGSPLLTCLPAGSSSPPLSLPLSPSPSPSAHRAQP